MNICQILVLQTCYLDKARKFRDYLNAKITNIIDLLFNAIIGTKCKKLVK